MWGAGVCFLQVPGAQSLKIIHEKFKGSKSDAARSDFLELFENAITKNADLTAHLSRAHVSLCVGGGDREPRLHCHLALQINCNL